MEYRRDPRDGLQPIRSKLVRFPLLSSFALASIPASLTLLVGTIHGGLEAGVSEAFLAGFAGAAAAAWFNPPLIRRLTPPTIALDLNQPDLDPSLFPADAEILAQRTKGFVESYFYRKSSAETVFAGGPPLDEFNAGGCWEPETSSVYVDRPTFIDASEWLNHGHDPVSVWSAWEYNRLRDSTGQLFLDYLHEFIHSATNPIGDIPAAWTEGVTELATRTAAAKGLNAVGLVGIDHTIGIKQTHKYDRYVAAISLIVLEVANLTDTPHETLIQGLVFTGCHRQGVKRFCSALVRACHIENAELEEKITEILLVPFGKLKEGTFKKTRNDDLEGVCEALFEVRFLLWYHGMNRQPLAIKAGDPYSSLLKKMGVDKAGPTQDQLVA